MKNQTDLKVSIAGTPVWGVCLGMRLIVQQVQTQASQWGIVSFSKVHIYLAMFKNIYICLFDIHLYTILVVKHIILIFPLDISSFLIRMRKLIIE
jgi:hypothetical protein